MSSSSSNNEGNDTWLMKIELKREEPMEINKDEGIKKTKEDRKHGDEARSKGDIIIWVWALPLATSKLGGVTPVSYHHHSYLYRFT